MATVSPGSATKSMTQSTGSILAAVVGKAHLLEGGAAVRHCVPGVACGIARGVLASTSSMRTADASARDAHDEHTHHRQRRERLRRS